MIPPIMYQATLLGEAGYDVDLLHIAGPTPERQSNHDGTCLRGDHVRAVCAGVKKGRRTSAANYARFLWHARALARRHHYDVFWGYDYLGYFVAHRLARSHPPARLVYHQNELYETGSLRFGARWLFNDHIKNINDADVVIIPDKNRAAYFRRQSGLKADPFVVGNYPLWMAPATLPSRKPGALDRYFPNTDPMPSRYVLYIGWFGEHSGVQAAVRSMGLWPPDVAFVIVGEPPPPVRETLMDTARAVGCADRVAITGYIPKSRELLELTASCHLGLALYQQTVASIGVHLSATSSNKVFEYMQSGLPVVATDLVGYRRIVEGEGVGRCVDAEEPDEIGRAVSQILADKMAYEQMSARARDVYLSRYNYDAAFQPVLDRMAALLRK